ncbi:MAG TPA: LptF/LptG family permease [Stellaceae bacterium]|nr:LptF/LptG family permease [Stellaceae bacterium]
MNGITRYILRQTIVISLFVTAALSIAVWLIQSLRLIDLIVNRGLSVGLFLHLALLVLPRFIDVVLPVAVFIAVLFVYNKLAAESEMVVMRAAGVSQAGLARPAIIIGLLATLVLYVLSLSLVPAANRAFKDLQFKIRNRFATVLIQDGVFNTISDRLMVYDMGRNAAGDLLGLVIYDARDPMKPVTIFAASGAFVDTPEGIRLFMVDGTRQVRDKANGHLSVLTFARYTYDLGNLGEAAGARDREPDERHTTELLPFARRQTDERAARALIVEFNLRLAGPLAGLAMALVPVLCLLPGEFNRRGQARRVLVAVALAFALEFVDLGLRDLSGRLDAAIPLLYLGPLLPLAAAAWLLWPDRRFVPAARAFSRLSG